MQHKKYQRKYKFSLVFGPTLWGHHNLNGLFFCYFSIIRRNFLIFNGQKIKKTIVII